jgi:hypothetical protein
LGSKPPSKKKSGVTCFEGGLMNLKLSGAAAGAAFVFSLLIGLISGAGILALVRAFIFGVVFFGMAGGLYWLALRFLPDLFEGSDNGSLRNSAPGFVNSQGEAPPPGSLLDISLGDEGREDVPEADVGDYISVDGADSPEISTFEDSGLDQKGNNGYTIEGDIKENPIGAENAGGSELPASPLDVSNDFSDLESLSTAFPSGEAKGGRGVSEFMITPENSAGRKATGGAGDLANEFDAEDMASAVQTILKRE